MKEQSVFIRAFKATLPVFMAYLVIGAGFGMLTRSYGMEFIWGPLMSLFIYAGAAQFVAANLFLEGASFLTMVLTTLFVNIRYLFYSFSMVEHFRGTGAAKPYLIFSLTDETYSILTSEGFALPVNERKPFFFFVSILNHFYWLLGTLLGSLAGSLLDINTEGIEFSLSALFVTIFINHWRTGRMRLSSLIGVLVSLAALLIFGADHFLLPAMLVIIGLLFLLRGRLEVKHV